MKLPIDKEWFERRAKAEADLEIGAGFSVVNVTDADATQMEVLAERALPEWAQLELARLRAIALDMQAAYVEANERAEEAVRAANALQVEVDRFRALYPSTPSNVEAPDRLLAHVASIICDETCGLTSQCKSREAAKALFDKGYLKNPSPQPNVTGEIWRDGLGRVTPKPAHADAVLEDMGYDPSPSPREVGST